MTFQHKSRLIILHTPFEWRVPRLNFFVLFVLTDTINFCANQAKPDSDFTRQLFHPEQTTFTRSKKHKEEKVFNITKTFISLISIHVMEL